MAADHKKLVKSKSGLRIVSLDDAHTSPFVLAEPTWIPDNDCAECLACKAKFDFFNRRHHCRRCGQCFCNKCCSSLLELTRMCFVDPVRQCENCATTSRKESEFFQTHVRTLITGASFNLNSSALPENDDAAMFLVYLSSDQRQLFLEFPGGNIKELTPIKLASISAANILTKSDADGNVQPSGITMKYREEDGSTQTVTLMVIEAKEATGWRGTDGSFRKQSILWIAAMQRALKLLLGKSPPGSVVTTP